MGSSGSRGTVPSSRVPAERRDTESESEDEKGQATTGSGWRGQGPPHDHRSRGQSAKVSRWRRSLLSRSVASGAHEAARQSAPVRIREELSQYAQRLTVRQTHVRKSRRVPFPRSGGAPGKSVLEIREGGRTTTQESWKKTGLPSNSDSWTLSSSRPGIRSARCRASLKKCGSELGSTCPGSRRSTPARGVGN